jgi:hypothetical protein
MAKFRKKPIEVDAWLTTDLINWASKSWKELPAQIVAAYETGDLVFGADGIHIRTPEGIMKAERNDVVICGIAGELYPCKPDIFSQTYEVSVLSA